MPGSNPQASFPLPIGSSASTFPSLVSSTTSFWLWQPTNSRPCSASIASPAGLVAGAQRPVGGRLHRLQVDDGDLALVLQVGVRHPLAVGGQELGLAAQVDRVGLGRLGVGPGVQHGHDAGVAAGGQDLVRAGVVELPVGVVGGGHVAQHVAGLEVEDDDRAGPAVGDVPAADLGHGHDAVAPLLARDVEQDLAGRQVDGLGVGRAGQVQPAVGDGGVVPPAGAADVDRLGRPRTGRRRGRAGRPAAGRRPGRGRRGWTSSWVFSLGGLRGRPRPARAGRATRSGPAATGRPAP